MRVKSCVHSMVLGAFSLALAATASAQVVVSVNVGPPPELPGYEQPPIPAAGYLWTPGYWAYDQDDGYYWVPGTWVQAPEPGMLWTPGYWSWSDNGYAWNEGYWAPEVGFYGGINYGYGYGGHGYDGGYWRDGALYYNRSVNHIDNTTNVTNVYNKTVVNNNTTVTNISYNGGNGGTAARPTPEELAVVHARHVPPTSDQTQHEHAAATNRDQWASTNHGKPAVVATAKPGAFSGQGVVTASRVSHTYNAVSGGDVAKRTGAPSGAAAHPNVAAPPARRGAPATEAQPKPTEIQPRPNEVQPNPTEVQPRRTETQPKPKDVQPKPDERLKTQGQPDAKATPRPEDQHKEDQHRTEARPKSSPPPEQGKQPPPPDRKQQPGSPPPAST